jgi:hypothetical protein
VCACGCTLAAIAAVLILSQRSSSARVVPRTLKLIPSTVLWAWERPEDFRSVQADHLGVAFLAETVHYNGVGIRFDMRRQPLRVNAQTPLVAVARVETGGRGHRMESGDVSAIAASIGNLATLPQVVAVQVDFDATVAEREFYRSLLKKIRARLQPAVPLSITSLLSWCMADDWIRDLPVDEIVPMAFRMGNADAEAMADAVETANLQVAACRGSIGFSMDERMARQSSLRAQRVYFFNPQSWSESSVRDAILESSRWR